MFAQEDGKMESNVSNRSTRQNTFIIPLPVVNLQVFPSEPTSTIFSFGSHLSAVISLEKLGIDSAQFVDRQKNFQLFVDEVGLLRNIRSELICMNSRRFGNWEKFFFEHMVKVFKAAKVIGLRKVMITDVSKRTMEAQHSRPVYRSFKVIAFGFTVDAVVFKIF